MGCPENWVSILWAFLPFISVPIKLRAPAAFSPRQKNVPRGWKSLSVQVPLSRVESLSTFCTPPWFFVWLTCTVYQLAHAQLVKPSVGTDSEGSWIELMGEEMHEDTQGSAATPQLRQTMSTTIEGEVSVYNYRGWSVCVMVSLRLSSALSLQYRWWFYPHLQYEPTTGKANMNSHWFSHLVFTTVAAQMDVTHWWHLSLICRLVL